MSPHSLLPDRILFTPKTSFVCSRSYSLLNTADGGREGAQDYHRVFNCFVNTVPTFVFFDFGTSSCYISDKLISNANIFPSKYPIQLRGVGGKAGPIVKQDCLITVNLGVGCDLSLTCGVVPYGTFPAPLVVGRSVLHQVGALFVPNTDKVQLTKIPGSPTLVPISKQEMLTNNISAWSVTEIAKKPEKRPYSQIPEGITHWEAPPTIPLNDQKLIQVSKDSLRTKFSELFNINQSTGSATRATGVKHDIILKDPNTQHKSAPARYSPKDIKIIHEFIESGLREGIIYKGQSPFSSRALLVPKDGNPKGRRSLISPQSTRIRKSLHTLFQWYRIKSKKHQAIIIMLNLTLNRDFTKSNPPKEHRNFVPL